MFVQDYNYCSLCNFISTIPARILVTLSMIHPIILCVCFVGNEVLSGIFLAAFVKPVLTWAICLYGVTTCTCDYMFFHNNYCM